jgi:hypothetical protein
LKLKRQPQPKPPAALNRRLGEKLEERNMGTATVPLCQHWMDNATRCGSPAMRGKRYCYSHQRRHEQAAGKKARACSPEMV